MTVCMIMGSLGGEVAKKKAMWLYPKVLGFNPSERWGHSACCSHGVVYVFGVCIVVYFICTSEKLKTLPSI